MKLNEQNKNIRREEIENWLAEWSKKVNKTYGEKIGIVYSALRTLRIVDLMFLH